MSGSSSPPNFTFNVNAVGGGGGGGSSPGYGFGDSGQNKNQDTGRGTTNPGQESMMVHVVKRERITFDVTIGNFVKPGGNGHIIVYTHPQATDYTLQTARIKASETTRIPKRFVCTALGYNIVHGSYPGGPNDKFAIVVDVLLVPISFKQEVYSDLYLSSHMGIPLLRDNIILLRRIAVHGMYRGHKVKECDIPENVRNRTGYRLVVTCPSIDGNYLLAHSENALGLAVVLEMEF
ncbi:hypothetical protein BC827DRAFT_1155908 [Russula dissimulans]|nr:hypothetical protein BC827DRAFT_1155908 [Russula dissimulans]